MAKKSTRNLKKKMQEDLIDQLHSNGWYGEHYKDLIQDYMFLFDMKDDLQKDIRERGLRYPTINGNGFEQLKPNESVQNLLKVNAQMLKILSDLGLQEPSVLKQDGGSNNEDYLS